MNRVVHFEIHAENPERAIAFYSKCFGWKFTKWEGPMEYWIISTGDPKEPGIDGGLLRRHGVIDGQAVIAYPCTIQVANIDEMLKKVESAGGQIVLPKMPIPGVGWLLYSKDTEGNIFGVMQPDASAM
ncbi:MAG: VOC family protein [candidate division Zixibacteria bacterium]|nr:VOC family protein [candidate division Zixibacteria bacterium]